MASGMPPFNAIDFGKVEAGDERSSNQRLLLDGYLDLHDSYQSVVNGDRFLVLGYKGSGKSAFGQHLELKASSDPHLNARVRTLNELSFDEFASIAPGHTDWQSRYPRVWDLVLLLQIIDLMRLDAGVVCSSDVQFRQAIAELESANLLPAQELASAIHRYSQHSLTIGTPTDETNSGRFGTLTSLVDQLEGLAGSCSSGARQILIIDGTDEILREERDDEPRLLQILTALLESSNKLNKRLVNAKIVVLCRTDLFDRLPGANKSKLRIDRSVDLNWYEGPQDSSRSPLAQLANLKAAVTDPSYGDIFVNYLPEKLPFARHQRRALTVLLKYTRHTPRDVLQLLAAIAKVTQRTGTGTGSHRVSRERVNDGIKLYSREYFGWAIRDEIWGPINVEERDSIEAIIRSLGRERFSVPEFMRVAQRRAPELDALRALESLFESSAIGNAADISSELGRRARLTFRHHNPEARFDPEEDVVVHLGWCRRLNILTITDKLAGSSTDESSSQSRRRARRRMPTDASRAVAPNSFEQATESPAHDEETLPAVPQTRSFRTRRRAAWRPEGPPAPQEGE